MESSSTEAEQLKMECSAMLQHLKNLQEEENQLRVQNDILAREALINGFELGLLEAPAPKRRKQAVKKVEPASN
jgi:regulator of replication initiation timing